MEISLTPTNLRRLLACILAIVMYLGLWAEIWKALPQVGDPYGLTEMLGLSDEKNFPTWVSSVLLFSCSALLAVISLGKTRERAPYVYHWWGLCVGFAFMSLDELVQLHERLNAFEHGGVLLFDWIIPAAFLLAILAMVYLRFLTHLDPRTRKRFLLAAFIYLGGAVLMEMPLGYWTDRAGDQNLVYGLIDWFEESLELIGASLFLYFLVEVLAGPGGALRFSLAPSAASQPISANQRAGLLTGAALFFVAPMVLLANILNYGPASWAPEAVRTLYVMFVTGEEGKDAQTVVRLTLTDSAGIRLMEETVGAGDRLSAGEEPTKYVVTLETPLPIADCRDLILDVEARHPELSWSWDAKMYLVALTTRGNLIRLVKEADYRFGSGRYRKNTDQIPLDCRE